MKLVLARLKHRRLCLNIRKQFYCDGDLGLTRVAQGGCGASFLADTQKLSGHNPGKLTVDGPALPPEVPSNLSLSVILYPEHR